jgi:hypothetical protein
MRQFRMIRNSPGFLTAKYRRLKNRAELTKAIITGRMEAVLRHPSEMVQLS